MTASSATGRRLSWKDLDADVVAGMQGPGDPPGDAVHLDADEAHGPAAAWLMKLPMPQPGSSTVASGTPRRARASCIACMTTGDVKNGVKGGGRR